MWSRIAAAAIAARSAAGTPASRSRRGSGRAASSAAMSSASPSAPGTAGEEAAELAVGPGRQVRRLRYRPREPAHHESEALEREGLGERLALPLVEGPPPGAPR